MQSTKKNLIRSALVKKDFQWIFKLMFFIKTFQRKPPKMVKHTADELFEYILPFWGVDAKRVKLYLIVFQLCLKIFYL